MWSFIIENKVWFVGLITGFFSFLGGRKTKKNQEEAGELQNLKTVREIEKQLFDDMAIRIDEYKQLSDDLLKIIEEKNKIIEDQKKMIINQKREIVKLKTK